MSGRSRWCSAWNRRSAGERCWRRGRAPRKLHLFERRELIVFVFAVPYQSGLLVYYGNGVAACAAAARLTIACHRVGSGCMLSSRCCGSLRGGHSQHRGLRSSDAPATRHLCLTVICMKMTRRDSVVALWMEGQRQWGAQPTNGRSSSLGNKGQGIDNLNGQP